MGRCSGIPLHKCFFVSILVLFYILPCDHQAHHFFALLLLHCLSHIDLGSNLFTGEIPQSIGLLTELEELYLDQNNLQYAIPNAFSALTSLHTVSLSENHLTSTLPASLVEIKSLKYLEAYSNSLTGALPSTWRCKLLKECLLNDNQFSSTVPSVIFKRTMTLLDLSNNNFEGPIRINAAKPPMKLAKLDVSNNALNGTLDPHIGTLSTLQHVSIDNNKFSGQLPRKWSSLKQLQELSIHSNDLSGKVADGLCALADSGELRNFTADCSGDPPQIECECCTLCYGVLSQRPVPR